MKTSVKLTPSRLVAKATSRYRGAVARAMPAVAAYTLDRIGQIVNTRLHRTAFLYMEGLHADEALQVTEDSFSIELQGTAQQLENGFAAFDLKEALLTGPNAKRSKDGTLYADVPFRHGAKANATRLKGMPLHIKAVVDKAVRRQARAAQRAGKPSPAEMRVTGRIAGGTYRQQRRNTDGSTSTVNVRRKTSIYSDMLRIKSGSSAMYKTFRRVSERSKAQSWWHPGFAGVHAFKQVRDDVRNVLRQVLKAEFKRGK
jgi:hypothetical protein